MASIGDPQPEFTRAMVDVGFPGLRGGWSVVGWHMTAAVQEPARLELELMMTSPEADEELAERNRKLALREAPEDAREMLRAMYDLEDAAAASDRVVVAEVLDPAESDGVRFRVRLVDG